MSLGSGQPLSKALQGPLPARVDQLGRGRSGALEVARQCLVGDLDERLKRALRGTDEDGKGALGRAPLAAPPGQEVVVAVEFVDVLVGPLGAVVLDQQARGVKRLSCDTRPGRAGAASRAFSAPGW